MIIGNFDVSNCVIITDNVDSLSYRKVRISKLLIPYKELNTMKNRDRSTIETGMDNLKVQVVVELGRTNLTFGEITNMVEGSLIELDSKEHEYLNIFANNVLIAVGEVIVFENDNFGIRVCEILEQKPEHSDPVIVEEIQEEKKIEGEKKNEDI
jgi:flagellar motor switch protein FliN